MKEKKMVLADFGCRITKNANISSHFFNSAVNNQRNNVMQYFKTLQYAVSYICNEFNVQKFRRVTEDLSNKA